LALGVHNARGDWLINGGKAVLGIDDPWIIAGFVLLFGSAIACVVYGAIYYNKDVDDEEE
jgi:hypothetical protein